MRRAAAPRSPRGAMSRSLSRLACALLLACLAAAFEPPSADWQRQMGAPVNATEAAALREEVREMFSFTYDSYMLHAFPRDELRPMSCAGHDTLGGYALTLVDALDSIALMGNHSEFERSVRWVATHLTFDLDSSVSVFETNIRVLGGLLSAHLLASDAASGHAVEGYDGGLLRLALDLGTRLLPAFATPTGIPFGAINLQRGVAHNESCISSTAGGGTLALEFSLLSALSGDARFEAAARRAVRGLWARRSALGLLGAHIDIRSGQWTHRDAGIGTSIDSFYEYLFKASTLLGDAEYGHMFEQAYGAVERHLYRDPWYVEVNMDSAVVVWPLFNSLQAFWPGLQALAGRAAAGQRTHAAFMSVWRRVGFTPEGYNLAAQAVQPGQASYPLRPELAESTYHLYAATGDAAYLAAGRDMVLSLRRARARCGYAMVADVATGALADQMESFFLAETVKYLYLLFDAGATSAEGGLPRGRNFVDRGATAYVFNTEGHPLPVRPQWRAQAQAQGGDGTHLVDHVAPGSVSDGATVLSVDPPAMPADALSGAGRVAQGAAASGGIASDDAPLRRGRRHAAAPPAAVPIPTCPAAGPDVVQVPTDADEEAAPAANGADDVDVVVPIGVSPTVAEAYTRYGSASSAVRALAAEVAAVQQGIVAAQLLAHVAQSGVAVHSMQIRVQDEGAGMQRVMVFVNGGAPVWASAPGVGPGGLLSLPEASPGEQGGAPDSVAGLAPVEDDDEYEDPGDD